MIVFVFDGDGLCYFFLFWWILFSLPFLSFNLLALQGLRDMLGKCAEVVEYPDLSPADISKSDIKLTPTEPVEPC